MQLNSPHVSKEHFRIYMILYEDGDFDTYPPMCYCEDLDSLNGTYVNDVLIGSNKNPGSPFLLSDGDIISLKPDWTFKFRQLTKAQDEQLSSDQLQETKVGLLGLPYKSVSH